MFAAAVPHLICGVGPVTDQRHAGCRPRSVAVATVQGRDASSIAQGRKRSRQIFQSVPCKRSDWRQWLCSCWRHSAVGPPRSCRAVRLAEHLAQRCLAHFPGAGDRQRIQQVHHRWHLPDRASNDQYRLMSEVHLICPGCNQHGATVTAGACSDHLCLQLCSAIMPALLKATSALCVRSTCLLRTNMAMQLPCNHL